MNYYMVFGSTKRPLSFGGSYLDWHDNAIGVYGADNAEDACKAAAADHGTFGTFFAIVGTVWGLEMLESPAKQLGRKGSPTERLNDHLEALSTIENEIQRREREQREHVAQLEKEVFDQSDDALQARIDEATAEMKRRKLETTMNGGDDEAA
jgi:hypothetical protein